MGIYILVLILSFIIVIWEKQKNKKIASFIIMALMLLVVGLRKATVGVDTMGYINFFTTDSYKYISSGEKLFYITYEIIKSLRGDENLWLFFVTALIYFPLFLILISNSPLPALSMFIYMTSASLFFPESMNIIRQSIAAVFLLLTYTLYAKNRPYLTFLTLIIASLFHLSSLIALPYLLLKNVRFSKQVIIYSLLIASVIGLFNFSNFMSELVANIKYFIGDSNDVLVNISKYSQYSKADILLNWRGFIFSIGPLITLCIITIPPDNINIKYTFYYNILFISTLLFCLLTTVDFGFRIVFGQMIVQILIIPIAYYYGNYKRRLFILSYVLVIIAYYVYYLYRISNIDSAYNMIIPYYFNWN